MKTVLIKTSLILFIFSFLYAKDMSYKNIEEDTSYHIYSVDINKDGIKDKVAYNKEGNELLFYIKKDNNYKKVYQGENYSFDWVYRVEDIKEYNENDNVLYIKTMFNGSGDQTIEYFIYYINKKWELNKSITTNSTYLETKICILNNKEENCYHVKNLEENNILINIIENLKNKKNIPLFSKEYIFSLFNTYELNLKTLTQYNDIAYYLQQANANNEAIFLLEKILEKFPNRTVAYLNLADAYDGLGNKEKAKENYEKYMNLMKQDNKEAKIPKRVLEYK
ncbi:hypothetical protein AVENP_1762 [Arcobacter venerupis]|uniref:Tetratricopeptide repeat protein n=1 Tax=Arcobacter venerupis TaxID=1054033 RepID=A0AAE7BBG5_9BACT|nr:tetratricopeptide repeat protein [Arcobacter venerupis]QKF67307.1 hypothetical protein AVENP_1762 [Arcobacter venerupis]RWS50675.1 hypothetical protein CKA56_03845 [Arcobacter venerupis]